MDSIRHTLANHLVLVIHGVGDPQPGETLHEFLRGMHPDRPAAAAVSDGVVWLPDACSSTRKVRGFPVHYRVVEQDGQRRVIAEVFWGDVSRVRSGKVGAVLGMLQALFGLRHVAYEAADQMGRAAYGLRYLTDAAAAMIRGPFAAINGTLLLLWLTAMILSHMLPGIHDSGPQANAVVLAVAAVSLWTFGHWSGRAQGSTLGHFSRWMAFWSTGVASLALLLAINYARGKNLPGDLNVIMWHSMILLRVLGIVWLIQTCMVLVIFACWGIARRHRENFGPALDAALLVTVLAVGLWGQFIPTAWRVAYLFVRQMGWMPTALGDQFEALFARSVPLMGMQWLMATCVALVFAAVSARHACWKRRTTARSYSKFHPAPRLLVPSAVQAVALCCALVGSATVVVITVCDLVGVPWQTTPWGRVLVHGNTIALSAAGIVGMAAVSTLATLRIGIDIALDVVTHFCHAPDSQCSFPYRDQLCARAAAVIKHFQCPEAHVQSLQLVTHSQGTIIGLGVLNSTTSQVPWHVFENIVFVTMGSPLRHLYQQYFPHRYPPLDHPHWQPLRQRVRLWVNIFRIDDFVGTYLLDPGTECVEWDEMIVVDHPVDPMGHTEYWTDRQVLEALRAYGVLPQPVRARPSYVFEDAWRRAA